MALRNKNIQVHKLRTKIIFCWGYWGKIEEPYQALFFVGDVGEGKY